MAQNRWKSAAPCGEDVRYCIKGIEQDCGVKVRITMRAHPLSFEALEIVVESYTETAGVRIGVARYQNEWVPGGRSLDAVLMLALHHLYERTYELANIGSNRTHSGGRK